MSAAISPASKVVNSAPELREGETAIDEKNIDEVVTFWRRMMDRWQGEENGIPASILAVPT